MKSLKIKVYENNDENPETMITIPVMAIRVMSKLIPKRACCAMQMKGFAINELLELAENPDACGPILEVKDQNERLVVALE